MWPTTRKYRGAFRILRHPVGPPREYRSSAIRILAMTRQLNRQGLAIPGMVGARRCSCGQRFGSDPHPVCTSVFLRRSAQLGSTRPLGITVRKEERTLFCFRTDDDDELTIAVLHRFAIRFFLLLPVISVNNKKCLLLSAVISDTSIVTFRKAQRCQRGDSIVEKSEIFRLTDLTVV